MAKGYERVGGGTYGVYRKKKSSILGVVVAVGGVMVLQMIIGGIAG